MFKVFCLGSHSVPHHGTEASCRQWINTQWEYGLSGAYTIVAPGQRI